MGQFRYFDETLNNIRLIVERYFEILSLSAQNSHKFDRFQTVNSDILQKILESLTTTILNSPEKMTSIYMDFGAKVFGLYSKSIMDFYKIQYDCYQGAKSGSSFKPSIDIYYQFLKSFYELLAEKSSEVIKSLDANEDIKKQASFYLKMVLDALHPNNGVFSNPAVLKSAVESNWSNVLAAFERMLNDFRESKTFLDVAVANYNSFEIGRNIACTPGKVIFRNDLVELIYYKPKDKVHSIPILIVPPCINKYYILDLSNSNSFVKWLVENEFEVFLISWVNPDKALAKKNFESYIQEGILDSANFIKNVLNYRNINAIGYCIGGTLLACALSVCQKKNINLFSSATFLTTLLDFANPGELGFFLNENMLSIIEEEVSKEGYLNGKTLSYSFSLLRSKDLIWNFVVNNYLLGKSPPAFDMLYWNADATNMPASMYLDYIKTCYIKNSLVKKNSISLLGAAIDLSTIDIPTFFLGAKSDHIVPWESAYQSARSLESSNVTFCLTASGHVAGVVNPASSNKYSYCINNKSVISMCHEEFEATALQHQGSWWNFWLKWQQQYSGKSKIKSKFNKVSGIEEAPGTYVKKRI